MKRVILTFEADEDLKKHLRETAERNKKTLSSYIRAALKKASKYKEVLVALLIFVSSTAFAGPIDPKDLTITRFGGFETMQLTVTGDMTVKEAFDFLKWVAPLRYNRIVIKDGKRYLRYGFAILPVTYLLVDRKHRTSRRPIKLR